MRPEHGGKLKIVDGAFGTLQDGDDFKGISVVLIEEALWTVEICGDGLRVHVPLARENKQFEAAIGRRQVLYVHLPRISGAHKCVREQTLADD